MKILFIEDEDFLLQGFIDRLEDRGHFVNKAGDAEEALTQLKNGQNKYDLVILDIHLPRGNGQANNFVGDEIETREMGLEILRQLRDEDKSVPVIVLTAVTDEDTWTKIKELGITACLYKPVTLPTFLSVVDKALS